MSTKNSINETLNKENQNLWNKVNECQKKALINAIAKFNVDIQGIPTSIAEDSFEFKVMHIFQLKNISVYKKNIGDCQRRGKRKSKNSVVNFVNRKYYEKEK